MPLPDLPLLPLRLSAPPPGWTETTDVVIVGSGIAGLTTALHLREAGLHVTVVTKVNVDDGSTRWAQGGIAAVFDPRDSPAAHAADTLTAGAGLCDPAAVDVLVAEGPARVRELIKWGAGFDRHPDGTLMLTREGGHHARRVVHAGGDATGAEVQRALQAAVRRDPWIRLYEHALVVDLLTSEDSVCGVTLHVLGEGSPDGTGAVLARAVVLATGGIGQVFANTTNPSVSTGDGVALALRAGAVVSDLEFVQFHPTALHTGNPRPLITEALRGEGAHLVDGDGKRFMVGQHELAELAPRDVVAKAAYRVMRSTGTDHVYLDARHLGGDFLAHRFPTIVAACRAAGIDPATELIPVAPAAHYVSGGVRTDLHGRTTVPGLYACGEVACTGVHGANRLASNSLLEGLVFARRIASDIVHARPRIGNIVDGAGSDSNQVPGLIKDELQRAMSTGAGVLRSADSLAHAAAVLGALSGADAAFSRAGTEGRGEVEATDPARLAGRPGGRGIEAWEQANLLTVATALVAAAHTRQETRGSHWREDWPETGDRWRGHLCGALAADGSFSLAWERT
jgi:L-aspartate oxidase